MKKEKKAFLVLILLILTFFLRLPSIFEPYWYGDEGITLTVGQQLAQGLTLYKDVVDNKTPLLYFLAAKTITLFNFKLLTLVWILTALLFFLKLTKIFTPKKELLSSLVFIFLTSTPILEGNIVNGEIYGILPMMISVYLFWQKYYFLGGIFACLSFLFKHPFLFDFLALLIFLIVFNQTSLKVSFRKVLESLAGFLLIFLSAIIYFSHQGALTDFFHHAIFDNFRYISWRTALLIPHGLALIKTVALFLFLILIYKRKRRISKEEVLVSLWLAFSLFGATLSTRPYPHYLLQVVPSFSLILGMSPSFFKFFLIILSFALTMFQFKLNASSLFYSLSYYQNFLKGNSYDFYGTKVKTTYEITAFLNKNAQPSEPIFIWSDNTLIYALSQRRPVGKYIAAYHITKDVARKRETIKNLTTDKPRYIIVTLPIKHSFPELDTFLAKKYNLIKEDACYQIYEIKN